MFHQILLSPQVKRWAIITYKHGIYELPNELPSALRRRMLGNWENSGKCESTYDNLVPCLLAKMKIC